MPDDVGEALRQARVTRLLATINGRTVKRARKSHADGGYFLILGQPMMRELGLRADTRVSVTIEPDPAPEVLDIPVEFIAALDQDDAARAIWDTFTLGKQRSLVYYVSSAKSEATRIKRSVEMTIKIRERQLYSDRTND